MKRSDVKYLYYIAPIENVPSILAHGILCHNLAKKINHRSVAMEAIQERRKDKVIPGAGRLHDYANLYLNARNPMMYKLKGKHKELCVLAVDPAILNEGGVIITDMNAAKDIARPYLVDEGLEHIDKDKLFAMYWTHEDEVEAARHRGLMCAEVLVPKQIASNYIKGVFVSCKESEVALKITCSALKIKVNANLFFQ
ncbi:MAG: DUF4433 domain-containing protein [bacterium]